MLAISHEDFPTYMSLHVDLTEDMSLVFIDDCSHPEDEDRNFTECFSVSKENTSLLALVNHITVQELPDFFWNKFKNEGHCLDAGEVVDVIDNIVAYLKELNIPYEYKGEKKAKKER